MKKGVCREAPLPCGIVPCDKDTRVYVTINIESHPPGVYWRKGLLISFNEVA